MLKKNKRFALALATAALGAVGVSNIPAAAQTNQTTRIYEYFYYSDAAKTQFAGNEVESCDFSPRLIGTRTPYYDKLVIGECGKFGGGVLY